MPQPQKRDRTCHLCGETKSSTTFAFCWLEPGCVLYEERRAAKGDDDHEDHFLGENAIVFCRECVDDPENGGLTCLVCREWYQCPGCTRRHGHARLVDAAQVQQCSQCLANFCANDLANKFCGTACWSCGQHWCYNCVDKQKKNARLRLLDDHNPTYPSCWAKFDVSTIPSCNLPKVRED